MQTKVVAIFTPCLESKGDLGPKVVTIPTVWVAMFFSLLTWSRTNIPTTAPIAFIKAATVIIAPAVEIIEL